ncbi:MAG: RNA polymerase sigma factor [Holophagaceae bacterium]|uniref:RNA polymerase sigma factor n=1 Tax=Candidatus Geothrix skivensis TaxID=2954439 RepID=A0A9D7SIK6_9BACT|nr:RNA polymerase sigma factor [Candidatus Geothrix skivensis]
MSRLKAGQEEALAHLMARFERPLLAFLHRRLQGEAGVVQELTQEVFLKCLQHCQRFEEGRPVAAWLFTLAANAATDHLRRRGREVPPPETFDAPDPHQATPWESVDQSRRIQALKGALEGLTPRQRAMVLAYYVQEHPVKRIAQDLSCAEGTVKATLFQSLQKLRKTLGPQP